MTNLPQNVENLTGERFGLTTAIAYKGSGTGRSALWECRCACGRTTVAYQHNLRSGRTRSCGHHRYPRLTADLAIVEQAEVVNRLERDLDRERQELDKRLADAHATLKWVA